MKNCSVVQTAKACSHAAELSVCGRKRHRRRRGHRRLLNVHRQLQERVNMNAATTAITQLYQLTGSDFDNRFLVMTTNIKRQLLEDFILAPKVIHSDVEQLLGDLSAAVIQTQKTACLSADISEEQKRDFENRIDNCLAGAIIVIRDCFAVSGDRASADFQLETAKRLGIPVA